MKPFDLEAAKRGEPICTRDGQQAHFIAHVPELNSGYRVVCRVGGLLFGHHEDGVYNRLGENENPIDLFMAPKKHKREVWVNLYEDGSTGECWWESSSIADNYAKPAMAKKRLGGKAARVVIEWEE